MFRFDQSMVDRSDFHSLEGAVNRKDAIDASALTLPPGQLQRLFSIVPRDESGRRRFEKWNFSETAFGSDVDFSDSVFWGTSFEGSRFGDRCSFESADFSRAVFNGAQFGDDAGFSRAKLGRKAEFHSASFGNRARFTSAVFNAAQFFATKFGDEAGFGGACFRASAKFHGTRFGPRGNFTEAIFPASVDFGGADFGDKLQMTDAVFAGSPIFFGASFGRRSRLTGWKVAGSLGMRSVRFLGEMSLHGAQIGDDAIFEFAQFGGSVDLGEVVVGGEGKVAGAIFANATRVGPLVAGKALRLTDVMIRSACALELEAPLVDFSDARLLAPVRVIVGGGEIILDRLQADSSLSLAAQVAAGAPSPRLVSVRGADVGSIVVSGMDVRALRFQGAEGIDGMRIESGASFEPSPSGGRTHREVIAEEHRMRAARKPGAAWYPGSCHVSVPDPSGVTGANELARIYRGLRKAREDSKDAPGAADFYYGEMEMRRVQDRDELGLHLAAGPWLLRAGNYLLLELYRLIGGYGVRPFRPLLALIILTIAASLSINCLDAIHLEVVTSSGDPELINATFEDCIIFVLRSALLLPTPSTVDASNAALWIQIGARILGPLLIGLFAFGLRARVQR